MRAIVMEHLRSCSRLLARHGSPVVVEKSPTGSKPAPHRIAQSLVRVDRSRPPANLERRVQQICIGSGSNPLYESASLRFLMDALVDQ